LLSIIVIVGALTYSEKFIDRYSLLSKILFVILLLFAGLAASRGDAVQYKDAYEDGFGPTFEPAINIIGNLCKLLHLGIYTMFLIFAVIAIALKFSFFKEASNKLFFVTLVSYVSAFYVSCEMGAIRFGAAIGFVLFSIRYIEDKKAKKFVGIILLGSLFHATTLLMLPVYYLRWKKSLTKALLVALVVSFLVSLIDIESLIDTIFENYFPQAIILVKYSTYFHEPAYFTPALLKRVLFFFTISYFFNVLKEKQKWFATMYIMYFLSIIAFLMFKANHTAASRFSFMFSSVEPVLFASLLLLTENKIAKLSIALFIFLYAYINLSTALISQTDELNLYLPYKLFFQR